MYAAKVLEEIVYDPNRWKGQKIGVFRIDGESQEQVGEYARNYSNFYNTFLPFCLRGKDLALYSPDYTVTRIMELPSCKDIGGEIPDSNGFCPIDYLVPTYIDRESKVVATSNGNLILDDLRKERINNPDETHLTESTSALEYTQNDGTVIRSETIHRPLTPLTFYDFGFVAGCIWGDDSSWKIQYLDLSEADKGILRRDERFGYLELPPKLGLKDAIRMGIFGQEIDGQTFTTVRIHGIQGFDLITGKRAHPFD